MSLRHSLESFDLSAIGGHAVLLIRVDDPLSFSEMDRLAIQRWVREKAPPGLSVLVGHHSWNIELLNAEMMRAAGWVRVEDMPE